MFVYIVVDSGACFIVKVFKHRIHAEECCEDLDPNWGQDSLVSNYQIITGVLEENTPRREI